MSKDEKVSAFLLIIFGAMLLGPLAWEGYGWAKARFFPEPERIYCYSDEVMARMLKELLEPDPSDGVKWEEMPPEVLEKSGPAMAAIAEAEMMRRAAAEKAGLMTLQRNAKNCENPKAIREGF